MRSRVRSALLVAAAFGALACLSGTALAAETWLCVPETTGSAVTSGGSKGECAAKNTPVQLPPAGELATLESILPHMKYVAAGIAGKPTVQFEAVNLQLVSGTGLTNGTVNGEGNLVIGYDENPGKHEQTGSNDLVLGIEETFTGSGGLVAGVSNTITGHDNTITGGRKNTANGSANVVSGGRANTVSGGEEPAWIGGGDGNSATEGYGAIVGGSENVTAGEWDTIAGGRGNNAKGHYSSVGGGFKNTASGQYSSIFGGKELKAELEYEAIP